MVLCLVSGALLAACSAGAVFQGAPRQGDRPAEQRVPQAELTQTGLVRAAPGRRRAYVPDRRPTPPDGPVVRGLGGGPVGPVSGAPRRVPSRRTAYVVRLEGSRVRPLRADERRVLVEAFGGGDALRFAAAPETASEIDLAALSARARAAGASVLCLLRFAGEGRSRGAAVELRDAGDGHLFAIEDDLEPSLQVAGAVLRRSLR